MHVLGFSSEAAGIRAEVRLGGAAFLLGLAGGDDQLDKTRQCVSAILLRLTGRGGYQGYFVYGFTDRNLYLLESIYLNNTGSSTTNTGMAGFDD